MEFVMLLLSSLLLITTRTVGASDAVIDVEGNALQRGQSYYVTSTLRPNLGLTPTPLKEPCPLYVAQPALWDFYLGQPLVFLPENDDDDTVVEGNTLYVKFAEPTQCPESTMWKVDHSNRVVTGGNTSESIGPDYSRFAIRKVGYSYSDYQFELCPCTIGVFRPGCLMDCLGTLGLVEEENTKLLSVNGNPLLTVRFVKVPTKAKSWGTAAPSSVAAMEKKEDSLIRSAVMRAN